MSEHTAEERAEEQHGGEQTCLYDTTRRGFMRGAVGTAATAAALSTSVAAAETTTTTTTETSDGSREHWVKENAGETSAKGAYGDYISKNTEANRLVRVPSQDDVATMLLLSSPITFFAAAAGRNYSREDMSLTDPADWYDAGRDLVNEVYFGPFDSSNSASTKQDHLVNAWYRILKVQQQYEEDLKQWTNEFELAEQLAYSKIQTTVRDSFNNGDSVSKAKAAARQAVRRQFASAESNLYVITEEVFINVNGVFYQVAAATDSPGLRDYWSLPSGFQLSLNDAVQGPSQPEMGRAQVRLMDGRVLETGVLEILYDIDEDNYDYDPDMTKKAIAHPLIHKTRERGKWERLPDVSSLHEAPNGLVKYKPPDTVADSEYQLLNYTGDLVLKCQELYDKLWDRVSVFDGEIDTYVDDFYNHWGIPGEDYVPASAIDTTALVNSLSMDWQQTKSSGFAALAATMNGYKSSTDLSMDVEVLTGDQTAGEGDVYEDQILLVRGDWIPDTVQKTYDLEADGVKIVNDTKLHIPGPAYVGEHTVTFGDGSTVTRRFEQLDHSGEWMTAGGENLAFRIDLGQEVGSLAGIQSVEATVEEAILAGKEYTVPTDSTAYPDAEALVTTKAGGFRNVGRGNRFIVTNITAADGSELDSLPIMNTGGINELSVNGVETLTRRHTWTRSQQEEEQREEGIDPSNPSPGAVDPDSDIKPWMIAAGGGVIGTALIALGLKDANGGGR